MRRRNKRRLVRYAIGAVVVFAYAVALFLFVRSNDGNVDSPAAAGGTDSYSAPAEPTALPSTSESASPTTTLTSLPPEIAPTTDPQLTLHPHIPGGIALGSIPSHHVVLSVTSAAAVKRVGYLVPTSLDNPIGDIRDVGTSWSVSTTAYGQPAYAEVFIQAGPDGVPITCTITVDGKVSNTATTHGAYGRQVCIG